MATREELLSWIQRTRRTQRYLGMLVAALAALSFALYLWRKPIGGFSFATTALIALVGFWVTRSHIDEWSIQLAKRKLF